MTEIEWVSDAQVSAMITLHNNFIDFSDEQSLSTMRCIQATRAILNALHKLSETSLDTTRLHPFIVVRPLSPLMSRAAVDHGDTAWAFRADLLVPRCGGASAAVQVLHRDRGHVAGEYGLGRDQRPALRHDVLRQ